MTNSATEFSPHFLVYGREMTDHLQRLCEVESELGVVDSFQDIVRQIITSRDLALQTLNETHKVYSQKMADSYNKKLKPPDLQLLQPVYLKTLNYNTKQAELYRKNG